MNRGNSLTPPPLFPTESVTSHATKNNPAEASTDKKF